MAYNEICNNENNACWPKKIKLLLNEVGLGILLHIQNHTRKSRRSMLKIIKQRLEDIEFQTWYSDIHNDSRRINGQRNKLRTFRTFKFDYKYEDYLSQVTNKNHRTQLTKLRLSSHNLEIETGRHHKPYQKPEERICRLCNLQDTEDEIHFLLKCPVYRDQRSKILKLIEHNTKIEAHKLSEYALFCLLIDPSRQSKETQKAIAKHVYDCFTKRKFRSIMARLQIDMLFYG